MGIRDTSQQDMVIAAPRWWRQRRWQIAVLAIAVLALVLYFSLRMRSDSSRSFSMARISVAEVKTGTLVRDAAVNGRLVAANSPSLFAGSAGTVQLLVKAGDAVRKGDVLAELESPDLQSELKREQAILDQLEAEIARQKILARKQKLLAVRDADQAEIERVAAERAFQRIEKAGVAGVVQKNEFQRVQDNLHSAEIRARHASQASLLESEDVDLVLKSRIAQWQQQRLHKENLERRVAELRLRAPVDGVVGTLAVANRSVVTANAALMTLIDLSQLEVELEIPESYVTDLGIGMRVELDINGIKAQGKLSAMSPEVVKNQVLARVRFDAEVPAGLRQSQRVSARLLIEEKKNVLLVQRGAFVESEGGRYVYVLKDGIATRTPVRMGATSIAAVEFISGLKPGDQVIISGTELFEQAQAVRIHP